MVGNDHQVARAERGVDTARSIRHEKVLDAEQCHHTHREGYLRHVVALIVVETPLHCHHLTTLDRTENHATLVSLDRRYGETRNRGVVQNRFGLNLIAKITQSGTENDTHFGGKATRRFTNPRGCFFNFL